MILRRFRKQARDHNWFAVFIDILIVLVGVFLGLQANAWNQGRLDRARATSYRTRLIEDLRGTEQGARASLNYYRDVRGHALAALAAFDRPASELGVPFLVDAYQASQVWLRSARHPTYDEILSSGNAELMGPPELRERLSNFYWRMGGLMATDQAVTPYRRVRSLMPYDVQSRIRARCEEVLTDGGKGLVTSRLPPTCPIEVPPAQVRAAIDALRSAHGLKQDLTGALIDLDLKLLNFGKLETTAREMRGVLEKAAR